MSPTVLRVDRFSTRQELTEALGEAAVSCHLLGGEVDDPREFYCFRLVLPNAGQINVVVLSIGMGTKPGWSIKASHIFIGFNDRVAVVSSGRGIEVRQFDLLTLFAAFIDVPGLAYPIVVGESAVVAVSTAAEAIWRRDTDLITNFQLAGTQLHLTFSDESPLTIELMANPGRPVNK